MQKAAVDIDGDGGAIADDEPPLAGKMAEVGHLHIVGLAERPQRIDIVRRHRNDHPLLRLRQPDLPWCQARILEGGAREIDIDPEFRSHLADRGREPPGAAIGDARIQPGVSGGQQDLGHLLLHDRRSDLYGRAGQLTGTGVHHHRREGGTSKAIAPRPAAKHDDPVARRLPARVPAPRGNAGATTVDQRVGRVAGVIVYAPVDGRDTHLVAVVLHARDDACGDQAWMQTACRDVGRRGPRRAEAQHVGGGDRPRRHTQDIPYHAADSGVCAAERLYRRRMVVRLHLERQFVLIIELDDAGIVDKRRQHPRRGYLVRRLLDIARKDIVDERRIVHEPA